MGRDCVPLVVAQGQIGFLGHEFPFAGALHGLNALALFGAALYTGVGCAPRRGVLAPPLSRNGLRRRCHDHRPIGGG